jgi:dolichol-phosphate mannosyltransferase
MSKPTVALVLLTWNEHTGLTSLWDKIPIELFDEIICIDRDSNDGTLEFLEGKGVNTVQQQVKGRGYAIRLAPRKTNCDYLLYFSPDGNEDVRIIHQLVKAIQNDDVQLVIASRFAPKAKSDDSDDPFYIRKVGNLFYTLLSRIFWRTGVTDAINGFRIVNRKAQIYISQDVKGHVIEFQQTIRMAKANFIVKEIPTIELERIDPEERKAKTMHMGLRFLRQVFFELIMGKRVIGTNYRKKHNLWP